MMKSDADKDTREKLNLISAQIELITRLTKDLKYFARVRPAARKNIDINAVVEASIRLASFDAGFQKLEVVRDLAGDLQEIHADGDQLQQVILNLLLNARDAMPAGGTLTVATRADASGVHISVEDTGPGIDESVRKQLFDPFFTTKPAGKGTGLGLAVCYGIVTAHNGRIEVDTNGTGTIFTVTLPAS
jgi:two-component system NtrC family sensor kinase